MVPKKKKTWVKTWSEQTRIVSVCICVCASFATKAILVEDRFKAQMVWHGVCLLQANCSHTHTHAHTHTHTHTDGRGWGRQSGEKKIREETKPRETDRETRCFDEGDLTTVSFCRTEDHGYYQHQQCDPLWEVYIPFSKTLKVHTPREKCYSRSCQLEM